jgi:arginase
MRGIATIIVPYELGRLRQGVGCGPERLLEMGAEVALGSCGANVTRTIVELDDRYNASGAGEADAAFELTRLVATEVRSARAKGHFPVMLSGSCFPAVGVVAGLGLESPGVVWFDAHSDFSEPATTISGYFDSMGLSVLTGSAWQALLSTVPGAKPVPESAVVLAGARAFDPCEAQRLAISQIRLLGPAQLSPQTLNDAVAKTSPEITGLYIHIDLDVLDAAVAGVNVYSEPNGPDAEHLDALVAALMQAFPVCAISLTAYDPAFDLPSRVPPIAQRLLRTVARNL